jgi:hypothetical protein
MMSSSTTHSCVYLPDHILKSSHFANWRALFPDDTTIDILDDVFVSNFHISSQHDFDRIIRADCYFGFEKNVYTTIFRNLERFWLEDAESSPITLCKKNVSQLANQIVTLFTERRSTLLITVMKFNQIELFDYIVERDGVEILQDGFSILGFPVLYYAVVNNHVEILRHGIDKGLVVTNELLIPAIDNNNLEIARIVFERLKRLNCHSKCAACKSASPEMFRLFLEFYQDNLDDLLEYALHNLNNFKVLLTLSGTKRRDIALKLLSVCTNVSIDIRVVMYVENHFAVTMRDLIVENEKFGFKYMNYDSIQVNIIADDNLGLYTHLFNSGFIVSEVTFTFAVNYLCKMITPGLVRKHIKELSALFK